MNTTWVKMSDVISEWIPQEWICLPMVMSSPSSATNWLIWPSWQDDPSFRETSNWMWPSSQTCQTTFIKYKVQTRKSRLKRNRRELLVEFKIGSWSNIEYFSLIFNNLAYIRLGNAVVVPTKTPCEISLLILTI